MVIFMRASGRKIKQTELANTFIRMVLLILASGKMTSSMVRDLRLGL